MADLFTKRQLETAGLLAVLLIAAGLRLWRLDDNGFGTDYYAAGVRSMLQGGWLFFYNSFDPAGFVSLDKPPVAFWIQTAFASLLGFTGWAIHLPQALAGTGSVALLYRLVRRPFGAPAGSIAALLLAVTPIAVAVDRSNNTDSWLVFFLLLAAGAALRGRGPPFVGSMALLGVAFNVKMLAALVCGPALVAAYLLASPFDWRRQLGWLTAGGVTLLIVGLSWAIAFDLTARNDRPYAGSSADNSMLELIVVHNGLERFVRNRPSPPITAPAPTEAPRLEAYDSVPTGPLRLANPNLASQFAWLLPIAVLGLVLARRRDAASLALWGVWMVTYGIVYSAAGGIFHIYYLSTLAPPLAALAGIGFVELWRRNPSILALGLGAAALWQAYVLAGPFGWSTSWIAAPGIALLAAIAVVLRGKRRPAFVGAAALLVLPAAWALSVLFAPGNLMLPSSSLARWLGIDDGRGVLLSRNFSTLSDDPKLHDFLLVHRGNARFLAVAPSTRLAAPVIIRTGQPVLAAGGFSGNDPILSPEALAKMVARGEVRFVLLSSVAGVGRRANAQSRQRDFIRWVQANGLPVKDELWRSLPTEPRRSIALYDLAPQDNI
jgi:4-amino-4-deoxy-L-arabinose transferase-like glycosyltransferase